MQTPLNNLIRAHKRNRLGSALLFLGADNDAMKHTALELAHAMIGGDRERLFQGHHPNVTMIMSAADEQALSEEEDDEKKHSADIKIDQIREMVAEHKRSHFEEGPVFFIIVGAQHLTVQAANGLLKTLEEPGANKYIILLAPSKMSVLPTIRSRCQYVLFAHAHEDSPMNGELFRRIDDGSLEERWEICQEKKWSKDEVHELLASLKNIHLAGNGQRAVHIVEALLEAQQKLKAHMNAQLVLEELLLKGWPNKT